MLKFVGGPAEGAADGLILKRAPRFLRAVCNGRVWDALDQVEDSVGVGGFAVADRMVEGGHPAHVQMSGPGGRGRRCVWAVSATYRFVQVQPSQDVLCDNARWQEWCRAEDAREKANA